MFRAQVILWIVPGFPRRIGRGGRNRTLYALGDFGN